MFQELTLGLGKGSRLDPFLIDSGPVPEGTYWTESEILIDNVMARNDCIIVVIRWSGLAPWVFGFPFPGSLTSTFLSIEDLVFGMLYAEWWLLFRGMRS